jgi:hypothetical protein
MSVDLKTQLKAAVEKVGKLHRDLEREQAGLRGINGREKPDDYAAQRERVNALKAEIGAATAEHGELARAVTLISGGTNHKPPAG